MSRSKQDRPLSDADFEWLKVRDYLQQNRYLLAQAAATELYPDVSRILGTSLLTTQSWLPTGPLELERISLTLDTGAKSFSVLNDFRASSVEDYSQKILRLAPPAVFENRTTFRLDRIDLTAPDPKIVCGLGKYFDGVNIGEAIAHEFASDELGRASGGILRATVGDPTDLSRRPVNLAVSTLTIRYDRARESASFLLHWRDLKKVGHAGGLYQVVPAGVFQPVTDHPESLAVDFSLWLNTVREFAEELLGAEERRSIQAGEVEAQLYTLLNEGKENGSLRISCIGMGVDPLTLATDLLCVAVFDAPLFDEAFDGLVKTNDEGELLNTQGPVPGVPFDDERVRRVVRDSPMQAAGAATLTLAMEHREALMA